MNDSLTNLPKTGFVRLPVVQRYIPYGKTTFWNMVKAGTFPEPIKLSPNITAWRAEDIHAYIASFKGGQND